MPENIDAVRELILQDSHVTYREVESSLGISSTSIHSILHEHLAVKKNLTNAQKEVCVNWCKKMLEKYDDGASKDICKSHR